MLEERRQQYLYEFLFCCYPVRCGAAARGPGSGPGISLLLTDLMHNFDQEWIRNGTGLPEMGQDGSEMGPDYQKWVRNRSKLGPDYQKWVKNRLEMGQNYQKWFRNKSEMARVQEWVRNRSEMISNS